MNFWKSKILIEKNSSRLYFGVTSPGFVVGANPCVRPRVSRSKLKQIHPCDTSRLCRGVVHFHAWLKRTTGRRIMIVIPKSAFLAAFLLSVVFQGQLSAQEPDRQWFGKVGNRLRTEWLTRYGEKGARLSARRTRGKKLWRKVVVTMAQGTDAFSLSGLRLTARRGRVAAGVVDLEALPLVAANWAVEYIRSERYYFPNDDPGVLSVRAVRTSQRLGLTGKGVIIGVLDSGIDWSHPDFVREHGTTRIVAVLDLSEPADSLQSGDLGTQSPYGGILVTGQEIERALRGEGNIRQKDFMGHGTHVAGTAAASPALAPDTLGVYGGVANGADLVAVKVTPVPRDSVFGDVNIMNGLSFIDSLALALGKPYVCNMSFGSTLGAHDGSDPFEKFLASFAEPNLPGRALVVASGNSRGSGKHAIGDFTGAPGDSIALKLNISGQGAHGDELCVEIWLSSGHPGLELSLVAPDSQVYGPYPDGFASPDTIITKDGVLFVDNAFGGPNQHSGDRLIAVELYDLAVWDTLRKDNNIEITTGTWHLVMKASTGFFDAYLYSSSGLGACFGSHVTELGTVTTPGTSPELITVGAYAVRADWFSLGRRRGSSGIFFGHSDPGALTYFSGLGPNRKGVLKPEITAPGRWVMASLSCWAWPVGEKLSIFNIGSRPLMFVATDSIHGVSQGTSFAAPHVAGVCALLLEADPSLTNSQIKSILTATAATDSMTTSTPDNYWGHGRVNAISATRRVLGFENDTLYISAALNPPDTLWTDSLAYTVSIDFSSSSQELISFSMDIHWPPESLRVLLPLTGTGEEGALNLDFDMTALNSGLLGITGFADSGLPAGTNLVDIAFTPLSSASLDSVTVIFGLKSLQGDLEPFELSGSVEISQASQVALRPLPACEVPGDVDRSGELNVFDLIQMLRILSGRAAQSICSDIDRNGGTDIFDLLELLRLLAGR